MKPTPNSSLDVSDPHALIFCPDVDTPLLSSAIIFLPGITPEETIEILDPLDFTVTRPMPSQITVTASDVMAPIEEFEQVLRSTVYSTTRQM